MIKDKIISVNNPSTLAQIIKVYNALCDKCTIKVQRTALTNQRHRAVIAEQRMAKVLNEVCDECKNKINEICG